MGLIKEYHLPSIRSFDDPKSTPFCFLNINEKVEHSKMHIMVIERVMIENLELYIKDPSKNMLIPNSWKITLLLSLFMFSCFL